MKASIEVKTTTIRLRTGIGQAVDKAFENIWLAVLLQ